MQNSTYPERSPGARRLSVEEAAKLRAAYTSALNRQARVEVSRQRINADMRACRWANQTADARKWTAPDGGPPFPWAGASDMRVPLVDYLVNVDVALMVGAEARRQTTVTPLQPAHAQQAAQMQAVLHWLRTTQMPERPWELRLFANYLAETGRAVMATVWRQRWQYDRDEIDLETIRNLAQQQQQAGVGAPGTLEGLVPYLPQLIQDPRPEVEDQAVTGFRLLYPDLDQRAARRAVRDLRTQGYAEFPRPYLNENRPLNVALCPGIDIILPPDTTTVREARLIFWRELMPEWKVRSLARAAEWDEAWTEKVIATKGQISGPDTVYLRGARSGGPYTMQQREELIEIIHAYERVTDDTGVEGIYYSVIHTAVEGSGMHTLLDYDHGEMPFVEARTEWYSRVFAESRGKGEVLGPFQDIVKRSLDWRVDRASISTLPPYYFPSGQRPSEWGPGVGLEVTNHEGFGFFKPPTPDTGADVVANEARVFAEDYSGVLRADGANKIEAMALRQEMVDRFLLAVSQIDRQILQLAQQYLPEEITYALVGDPTATMHRATREEIQGQFTVAVCMDVRLLDPEYQLQLVDRITKILPLDLGGRLNRDALLEILTSTMLPGYTGILLPAEAAAEREKEATDQVFAAIFAGVGQDVKPGQAYGLRLQRLQEILQTNPVAQQRAQTDEKFRKDIEAYMQQLQQQLVQTQVNPTAGRLGALPADYRAQQSAQMPPA